MSKTLSKPILLPIECSYVHEGIELNFKYSHALQCYIHKSEKLEIRVGFQTHSVRSKCGKLLKIANLAVKQIKNDIYGKAK